MDILLINPINKQTHGSIIRFPIGLAYISDALSKLGHKIEVLDMAPRSWNMKYLEDKIKDYSHLDALGLTGLISEYQNIKQISQMFKKYFPERPIILGGALATGMPEKLMNSTDIDIIVSGEGEATVIELFEKLKTRGDISGVRGIYFRKDGKIVYTGKRDYLVDLDLLGYPSRKGFDVEAYFYNSPFAMFGKKRTLNIITSRGCPYSCAYCDKTLWGSRYRARSPENIVSEIEYLTREFHIDSVIFHDDTFNIKKDRLIKLCDLLIAKDINVDWLANCRADEMSLEIAKLMRKAGCRIIAYGVESGNQEILDSMQKGMKLEEVSKAVRNTWKARIIPFAYLMIGWFNETKTQVLDTVNFCVNNRIKGDFSFFTPLPNTPAFAQIISSGKHTISDEEILRNWGRWHEKPMFNVSLMSDSEIVSLKKYAEKKILWSHLIDNIVRYMGVLGISSFIKELFRRVKYFGPDSFKIRIEKV